MITQENTQRVLEQLGREQFALSFLAATNIVSLVACFLLVNVFAWLLWRLRKYPYIVEDLSGFVQAEIVSKLEWVRPRWWREGGSRERIV